MIYRRAIVVALVLSMFAAFGAFAEYDRDKVVPVMRNNMAMFGQIRQAAGKGDFSTAAASLFELAKGEFTLIGLDPPQGSKEEWDDTHWAVVSAAWDGIKACKDKDADKLNEAIQALSGLNRAGHSEFRG